MKHYNPTISRALLRQLALKQGDMSSSEVEGPVVVIPVEFLTDWTGQANRTTSGTSGISVPSTQDLYITGAVISFEKDATATLSQVEAYCTVNGGTKSIGRLASNAAAGTARGDTVFIQFSKPIKPDRGTSISFAVVFGAGAAAGSCTLHGFLVETTQSG